ncbi:hypothetical protein [Streptomyces sp. NPDC005752]|uniref:hypothetical protein n=1 Tax=Streptomyces sp. NPDC005752 TaxID=3157065 RepID=UPI0033E89609
MSAEAFDGDVDFHFFAEERATCADAASGRRREVSPVRICGRTAHGDLGISPFLPSPGRYTAPRRTAEAVGSTTHRPGCRSAAVARARRLHSAGFDARDGAPLPAGRPTPRLAGRRTSRDGAVPTAVALHLPVNESPARASHTRAPSRASLGTENR